MIGHHDVIISDTSTYVKRVKSGDELAFNRLASLWYKRIFNFCLKYFGDHDLASDCVQKTFIKVYDKINQLDEENKFKSWLYTIALNICREEGRRRTRVSSVFVSSTDDLKDSKLELDYDEPNKQMENKELSEIVLFALSKLPDEQKTIVIMKEYEGMKFREIAEVLKQSENTVKSRLYYGLKAMKKTLEGNKAFLESYSYGR